jgi:hypothetical protein
MKTNDYNKSGEFSQFFARKIEKKSLHLEERDSKRLKKIVERCKSHSAHGLNHYHSVALGL